jgi:hypothetical protein
MVLNISLDLIQDFYYVPLIYDCAMTRVSNTAGSFATILGTVTAGLFVDRMGSFRGFLTLMSLLYFSSALF